MEQPIIRQEPQLPALKLPASGDLQIALESVLIRNATVEQIKEVLRLVMIKIGLRAQNWPTEEEKLVLIEHIVTGYGGHTVKEIKLAFDMAIAGRLETTNNKNEIITLDPNCYENFSCLYFSNIMSAYRLWAIFEVKQIPKKIELPPPKETEEMTDDEFIEMNYRTWNVLKNPGIISTKCYGILVAQKKINLSQEEKDKMFEQVDWFLRLKMNSDRNWHEELNPIWQSPNKQYWRVKVFNECKKKAVETYFKSL